LVVEHPGYRSAWRLLLGTLLADRQWQAAIRLGKQATKQHPLDPMLWERLALAYRGQGQGKLALQTLTRAQECAQQSVGLDPALHLRLQLEAARLHEELGHPEDALRIYRNLLDSGNREPSLFINAASCLKGVDRIEDAAALLRDSLRAHPDHADILTNLGEILFEAGRDQEAFELLQRATEIEPARTGNLILMAALCLRQRQFDTAMELASAVAKHDPDRAAEAWVIIGDAYRFQGSPEAAIGAYQAAQELAPSNEQISERIASIQKSRTAI
jgi:tetratricopeptide (TPR) repeat protein